MPDVSYPDNRRYHPEHAWVQINGDTATVGVSWFAQDQLGDLIFAELPDVGTEVSADAPVAQLESAKTISDVIAPVGGTVVETNDLVIDEPETVNGDPYGDGWLFRLRPFDPANADRLLDAERYSASLG